VLNKLIVAFNVIQDLSVLNVLIIYFLIQIQVEVSVFVQLELGISQVHVLM